MADPNELVTVNITVQDRSATVSNFGALAFIGKAPHLPGTFASYTVSASGAAAMITAGFQYGDAAYLAMQRCMAVNPSIPTLLVYSRTTTNAQSVVLTPTVTTENYQYSFNVIAPATGVSTAIEYTNGAAETPTMIATALQTLATAVTGVTATDNTGSFTITPTTSGDKIHLSNLDPGLDVEDVAADAGIAAELTAAVATRTEFYGFGIDSNCKAELVAAAAWATSNKRIFIGETIDSEVDDSAVTDDVVSTIAATSTSYANLFYTREPASCVGIGLLARQFSRAPGSSSWSNKTLTGVTVDTFDATEHANVVAKGALVYEEVRGISLARNGQAAGGRFFDVTRGTDWLASIIQGALISYLANQEKIDYTDTGIGEIEAVIRSQLMLAERAKFLAPNTWGVVVPKAADVSTADKAARTLTGVTFYAQLSGAIHQVIPVKGTISL